MPVKIVRLTCQTTDEKIVNDEDSKPIDQKLAELMKEIYSFLFVRS